MSDFWAGDIERLFQDLVLHGLAPEKSLEITNAFLPIEDARDADGTLICLTTGVTAFWYAAFPAEELRGRDAGLTSYK